MRPCWQQSSQRRYFHLFRRGSFCQWQGASLHLLNFVPLTQRISTSHVQVSLSGITRVSPQAVLLFGKDWTFDTVSSTGEHTLI